MKYNKIIWGILSLIVLTHCKDSDSYPDRPFEIKKTLVIAHRAGGGLPYGPYEDNTLEAAIYGFEYADGIEIDIQKSRTGTLWLFHDSFLVECNGKDKNRIPEKTDGELIKYATCKGIPLTQLEDIFKYHRAQNLDKLISLDVKSWLPSKNSYSSSYLVQVADKIAKLVKAYEMEPYVIVECETAMFLNRIKNKNKNIACHLTTFGDLEEGASKALKAGYEGLSFQYNIQNPPTKTQIKNVMRKGLKLQFWVINGKADFENALVLEPFAIQTDNILMKE